MTIRQIYTYCINELNGDEKYIDTELLIAHVLKKDRLYIKLNLDEEISVEDENYIKSGINELKIGKPIHYITKVRDFFGLDFFVEEGVLIPRSDTEFLVQESINALNKFDKKLHGLEIGVGSGIISVSLLKNIPNLKMTCIDINEKAILLSRKNAENLGVSDRILLINSNLYENLQIHEFDFIISNPPYIPTDDIKSLEDKVKNFEPINALDGRKDGLYFYDEILKESKKYLKKDFFIFFEIGYNQGEDLKSLFKKYNFSGDIKIIKDYNNNERAVVYQN